MLFDGSQYVLFQQWMMWIQPVSVEIGLSMEAQDMIMSQDFPPGGPQGRTLVLVQF